MAENVKKFQTFDGVEHDIEDTAAREGLNNVYTKAEADALLAGKVDSDEVYSKTVLNAILDSKADEANVYSKTATDDLLAAKANAADVYTKSEEDAALALKADAADVYSKTDVDAIVDDYTTKATFAAFQTDVNAEFQNRYTKSEDDALLAVKADSSDVYTKAEVDALIGGIKMFPKLDYANPLYTFSNTNTSYTATEECYLCGTLYPADQAYAHILINGTRIAANYVFTGGYEGLYVSPIKISIGDIVTVDNLANATSHTDRANVLHIFREITS